MVPRAGRHAWWLESGTRLADSEGAEGATRVLRQSRERGCIVVRVKESWLNGSPEIQDALVAFAGWTIVQIKPIFLRSFARTLRSSVLTAIIRRVLCGLLGWSRFSGNTCRRSDGAVCQCPDAGASPFSSTEPNARSAAHQQHNDHDYDNEAKTAADVHGESLPDRSRYSSLLCSPRAVSWILIAALAGSRRCSFRP